jgi:hypothetical protein
MELPDFETIFRFFFMLGGVLALILAAGFGFKRLGRRTSGRELAATVRELEARAAELDRLPELEARFAELEERLDFAERALVDVRTRAPIPPQS